VEALAESLVGDAHAVIKIDCAEFQHSHEIAKLIGSPPDILGIGKRIRCSARKCSTSSTLKK